MAKISAALLLALLAVLGGVGFASVLSNTPCTVLLNGVQQSGTCTGDFTPTPPPTPTPTPTAGDFYVSPSGSNANPGTQALPWKTISYAAGRVVAGNTVHVQAGTYNEAVLETASGNAAAHISFVSEPRWGAKVVTPSASYTWTQRGNYVELHDFDISAARAQLAVSDEGSFDLLQGLKVHDVGTNGCNAVAAIDVWNGSYNNGDDVVQGNLVYNVNCGSGQAHGIYLATPRHKVLDNIVGNLHGSGYGIHCWHACTQETISGNTVFNAASGAILFGAGDAPGGVVTNNMIVSDNIAINSYYGVREYEYSGQHKIGANNQTLNNNVYGNTIDYSLLEGNTQSGSVSGNAQFLNYQADGSGDYHLAASSPDVDAGTAVGAPGADFDGVARPQGAGYDIGAYER